MLTATELEHCLQHCIEHTPTVTCPYCQKTFSTKSCLNRHFKSSIVCDKWRALSALERYREIVQEKITEAPLHPTPAPVEKITKPLFEGFTESEPGGPVHIIWNVMLTDKTFTKDATKFGIKYVVAILPKEEEYDTIESLKNIPFYYNKPNHTVMTYDGHTMVLDLPKFDEVCRMIEECRQKRHNVLVFCNTGYQRSIPFLCYYLTQHHADEVPTLEQAIDIILPQVDKENYSAQRDEMIEKVTAIFVENGISLKKS